MREHSSQHGAGAGGEFLMPRGRFEDLPEVLRVADLLKVLPAGRKQIYAGLASGAIPAARLGKTYLISKRAFQAWLEAGR
jgi:excisionase family DNA binding protein